MEQSQEVVSTVLDAIYNTVIVKDILDQGKEGNRFGELLKITCFCVVLVSTANNTLGVGY